MLELKWILDQRRNVDDGYDLSVGKSDAQGNRTRCVTLARVPVQTERLYTVVFAAEGEMTLHYSGSHYPSACVTFAEVARCIALADKPPVHTLLVSLVIRSLNNRYADLADWYVRRIADDEDGQTVVGAWCGGQTELRFPIDMPSLDPLRTGQADEIADALAERLGRRLQTGERDGVGMVGNRVR